MNPITKLTSLGQSLWYDNIQRKILENGEFKAMIERGDIRGDEAGLFHREHCSRRRDGPGRADRRAT